MIKRTIILSNYGCKIITFIGKNRDIDNQIQRICRQYKIPHKMGKDSACVITTGSSKVFYLLFSIEYLTLDTLNHEIGGHLAPMIFGYKRKKITGETESYAKLCGKIANEIGKILKKNNIKIKYVRF